MSTSRHAAASVAVRSKPKRAADLRTTPVSATFGERALSWRQIAARLEPGDAAALARLDAVVERGPLAVALVAFIAVAREGFETVLFLIGAQEAGQRSGWSTVVGGVIGLAAAVLLAIAIYGYGHKIDLRRFFTVTGALLIVFAAGMMAKAVFELVEAMHISALEGSSLWTITSGPFATGWTYDFLAGMFGWTANEASAIRVVVYFAYLIPVGYLFFFGGRKPVPQPANRSVGAAI